MKLVTYNIRYSLGRDERFDLPRIARAVEGADIVALQEVERHCHVNRIHYEIAVNRRWSPYAFSMA